MTDELKAMLWPIPDEDEEYIVGAWEVWHRYQKGHAIARCNRSGFCWKGHKVYVLHKLHQKEGALCWTYSTYRVVAWHLEPTPTIDNMANNCEYIIISNGKHRKKVPIHAIGSTVFSKLGHAMREISKRNAELSMLSE